MREDGDKSVHQIQACMDIVAQQEKRSDEFHVRNVRDIDLKEKKTSNLQRMIWLPHNQLPLPSLSRDAIVAFVEEQTSVTPPAEHEELREILMQLSLENIPGPHTTMKFEILRLSTTKSFPGADRPFAIRIIGAGFYFARHRDQVICYCCGNRKDNWILEDIPLLIHQKMAPSCSFLTRNAIVNIPIRKTNSVPSPIEVRLREIERSDRLNQPDTTQSESSLMLPSTELNQINISSGTHQMLVANIRSSPNQLTSSWRQNVLDDRQTSAIAGSMEDPPPKYSQFPERNMRIQSFQRWPAELRQRPDEMAECGFYYAGYNDCVRCFYRGVGPRHWISEDDSWIEHARWSTSCLYVQKIKGGEFVSLVKMGVEITEEEEAARNNGGANKPDQNNTEAAHADITKEDSYSNNSTNYTASRDFASSTGITGCAVEGAAASASSPGKAETQKYLVTDAAQSVLDMGYQPKLVLQAIERILMKKDCETAEYGIRVELPIDPEKIRREHRELREATLCKNMLRQNHQCGFSTMWSFSDLP